MIWIDFETRSECDLPARGAYNYARDPSTTVLCMAWALDDGDVAVWTPGQEFPKPVSDAVRGGAMVYAHNAAFERLIWTYVLGPDHRVPVPPLEKFYCTAAQARANCAPGSLEDVGRFAGTGMRKDHRGAALVRKCCVPPFRHTEQDLLDLFEYCAQDVRTMRAVSQAMRPLSSQELADYHVNERINDRGVLVDVALAQAAQRYAAVELDEIQRRVVEVTAGEVTSVRSPRMREWVLARLGPEARALCVAHKDGEAKDSIDKSVRANLLTITDPEQVPPDVAEVIQAADDLWASSAAKFGRMVALADEDDARVRGAFVFAGGAATGRASSYGLQAHNFPRPVKKVTKDTQLVRDDMVAGLPIAPRHGPRVTDVLKSMLRPALIPAPGKSLVVADWSAIEGRVHPWLSHCPAGNAKLEVFRRGLDPYIVNAAATFGRSYDAILADHEAGKSDERQVGKVQELACLGPETQVLTRNGLKAIVNIELTDQLWDGAEWVSHQGVIAKGRRRTMFVCGMEVTPDHLIRTGTTWTQARRLVSNEQLMIQALETGSANLPSWALNAYGRERRGSGTLAFSARAGLSLTWSTYTIFSEVLQRGVTLARKSRLGFGEKAFTSTPKFAQTMSIGGACSIGYLHVKTGATTPKIKAIQTMGAGGYSYTSLGERIRLRFCDTSFNLTGGINQIWSWIASMSIKATNRGIFGSSQDKLTARTSAKSKICSGESWSWRPVYDILNSGPRNQFTVFTDSGPLIVHNCGFLGGPGSFRTFGRIYNVHFTEADAQRMVSAWRRANPWAMLHGQALEGAAHRAMRNPGAEFTAGRVTYLFDKTHLWYALPSGRVLCYPYARMDSEGITYAKSAWKPAADAKEWPRARIWPGILCENITQAVAHDILREALRQLDGVVLHVHDEIVIESDDPDRALADMSRVMTTAPAWAPDLPLAVEAKVMQRYGK